MRNARLRTCPWLFLAAVFTRLSPMKNRSRSQLAALARIHDLINQGCQFLIATHLPILTAYPGATIYAWEGTGINRVAYQDTEHYRSTRDFLQAPEQFLRELLNADLAGV